MWTLFGAYYFEIARGPILFIHFLHMNFIAFLMPITCVVRESAHERNEMKWETKKSLYQSERQSTRPMSNKNRNSVVVFASTWFPFVSSSSSSSSLSWIYVGRKFIIFPATEENWKSECMKCFCLWILMAWRIKLHWEHSMSNKRYCCSSFEILLHQVTLLNSNYMRLCGTCNTKSQHWPHPQVLSHHQM